MSNLPGDVNEAQLKVSILHIPNSVCSSFLPVFFQDLFSTTVGPLREVTLHFDASGRSKGTATVAFQRKGDGSKAYDQYNNRLIDGS